MNVTILDLASQRTLNQIDLLLCFLLQFQLNTSIVNTGLVNSSLEGSKNAKIEM